MKLYLLCECGDEIVFVNEFECMGCGKTFSPVELVDDYARSLAASVGVLEMIHLALVQEHDAHHVIAAQIKETLATIRLVSKGVK